jgi:hypothetical protein
MNFARTSPQVGGSYWAKFALEIASLSERCILALRP